MKSISFLKLIIFIVFFLSSHLCQSQSWKQVGQGVTGGSIRCMIEYKGDLYLGGDFTSAGGKIANGIAKWDGANYTVFGSGCDPIVKGGLVGVFSMSIYNNELYIKGSFTKINGISADGLAKFDGVNWVGFLDNYLHSLNFGTSTGANYRNSNKMPIFKNKLIVGVNNEKIITYDGVKFDTLPGSRGAYFDNPIVVYNGELYANGQFSVVTKSYPKLCKFNGANWVDVEGFTNGSNDFLDLVVYKNKLFAMGSISSIGGLVLSQGLAAYDGSKWDSLPRLNNGGLFMDGSGSSIYNFKIFNSELLINGPFILGSYFTYNHTWDGTNWNSFKPNLDSLEAVTDIVEYKNINYVSTNNYLSYWYPNSFWYNNSSSIQEVYSEISSVSPNPSSGKFKIVFTKSKIIRKLKIFNSMGQLLVQEILPGSEKTVDLSNFSNGIYVIVTETDNSVSSYKIIKE